MVPHETPRRKDRLDVVRKTSVSGNSPLVENARPATATPHGLSSQSESFLNACLIWDIPADSSFSKVAAFSLATLLFPWI